MNHALIYVPGGSDRHNKFFCYFYTTDVPRIKAIFLGGTSVALFSFCLLSRRKLETRDSRKSAAKIEPDYTQIRLLETRLPLSKITF